MSAIFPWGIHIWNFKTLACTVHRIWHASKSVTNGRTDAQTHARMDNPRPICPLNFFEVGGIIKHKKGHTGILLRHVILFEEANFLKFRWNETMSVSYIHLLNRRKVRSLSFRFSTSRTTAQRIKNFKLLLPFQVERWTRTSSEPKKVKL